MFHVGLTRARNAKKKYFEEKTSIKKKKKKIERIDQNNIL